MPTKDTVVVQAPSAQFSLNALDRKKIGKGLLIAIAGAAFTYLESIIMTMDFGDYTPIVMTVNTVLVNMASKFFSGK